MVDRSTRPNELRKKNAQPHCDGSLIKSNYHFLFVIFIHGYNQNNRLTNTMRSIDEIYYHLIFFFLFLGVINKNKNLMVASFRPAAQANRLSQNFAQQIEVRK